MSANERKTQDTRLKTQDIEQEEDGPSLESVVLDLFLLSFLIFALVFGGFVSIANAAIENIEGTDSEGDDTNNEFSIRGIQIWLRGDCHESRRTYLDNLLAQRQDGTWITITTGDLWNGGHELDGLKGTYIASNNRVRTDGDGEYYVTFILPFDIVTAGDPDGDGVAFVTTVRFQTVAEGGTAAGEAEGSILFTVQIPRFDEVDIDTTLGGDTVRNGDTIELDIRIETHSAVGGDEIEVVTLLPDFSNVDAAFHAPAYEADDGWNYTNAWTPDVYDHGLDELVNDVQTAMRNGRLVIEERGNGRYNVSYTISDDNVTEPGMKDLSVHAIDYPSDLRMGDIEHVFNASGLILPDDLNIITWGTPLGDNEPIDLDSRAPDFDFVMINPFSAPKTRWIDTDNDGIEDGDEWVYVYKEGDIVSAMVQIDPHELNIEELSEVDPEDIDTDGVYGLVVGNVIVVGDISDLLDPSVLANSTDYNGNGIADVAEINAQYAGRGGGDDDYDGEAANAEDDEDSTVNGFNERFLYVFNFTIDNKFKAVSGNGLATTYPLSIRFMIEDSAGNQTRYSAWREIYDEDMGRWRTVAINRWPRDGDFTENNPVLLDEDNGGYQRNGGSIPHAPDHTLFPDWDPGRNIVENWDQPWRVIIDAASPSVAIFDQIRLQVWPRAGVQVKGAVLPGDVEPGTGMNVRSPGNFIYEMGGDAQNLVTLEVSFPGANDVDLVKFMYSDSDIPGSYRAMKGTFAWDYVMGLYDVAGNVTDAGVPGAKEYLYHDGINGDDDNDGYADFFDRQVRNAERTPQSDGLDNDADGLVDVDDTDANNCNTDFYDPERDEDEDGLMDEDSYIVNVDRTTNTAIWTFDPVHIARVLGLSSDRAYAIKAVPYDLAGNAVEPTAAPIYAAFRVTGPGIGEAAGTATVSIYKNGQPVASGTIRENYTYDLVAVTTGTVSTVAFQYSMDKRTWVNMPTASGEPNPDPTLPFRISWRPMLAQLATDLWIDVNNNGVRDSGEPVYRLGDTLYIRAIAGIFRPVLGKYVAVDGLTIDPQAFVPYFPEILSPLPTSTSDVVTAVTGNTLALCANLYPGWNLISICLDTENSDILSVLSPIAGLYRSVWAYDAASGEWERYIPDGPTFLNNLDTMEPGRGYWIDMMDEAILTVTGRQMINMAVQLHRGWNLVGYNSYSMIQSRDTALASIAGKYTSIWTYDSTTQSWLRYISGSSSFLNNLNELESSKGYWIYVEEDCKWIVSPD